MTLGNTRELGARMLFVSCWQCHHQAVLSADRWPDDVVVPTFGADARPNWKGTAAGEADAAFRTMSAAPRKRTGAFRRLGPIAGAVALTGLHDRFCSLACVLDKDLNH
jgi:hypothetical protein